MKGIEKIAKYLKNTDITMYVLAQKTGLSDATLSRIKNLKQDSIEENTLKILCDALNLNIEDFQLFQNHLLNNRI